MKGMGVERLDENAKSLVYCSIPTLCSSSPERRLTAVDVAARTHVDRRGSDTQLSGRIHSRLCSLARLHDAAFCDAKTHAGVEDTLHLSCTAGPVQSYPYAVLCRDLTSVLLRQAQIYIH